MKATAIIKGLAAAHVVQRHVDSAMAHAFELMPSAAELARARHALPSADLVFDASQADVELVMSPEDAAALAAQVRAYLAAHPELEEQAAELAASHVSVSFDPTPHRVQPAAHTLTPAEERVVRRSIAGEDVDDAPRLPSLAGFTSAGAASDDWGVPVRSTSSPDRFGKGAMRGGGGRPHDPHLGREQYALAERELERIARALPTKHTRLGAELSGPMQVAIWVSVKGPGKLVLRNLYAAEHERHAKQLAARARKLAEGKDPERVAQPPAPPRSLFVPERSQRSATEVSDELRAHGIDMTPHEVGIVCRHVGALVREAFEAKGWVARAKRETTNEGSESMATADYIDGWGEIAKYLRSSIRTAQALAREGLPVRNGLSRGVCARSDELDAWQDKRRKLRSSVWNAGERDDCAPLRDSASTAR